MEEFSREQRLIFALAWYMSEVNNGGHHQFYSNSTGIVWKDACRAFSAINIKKGADIILSSADRMDGDPSLDRDVRREQLAKFIPDFGDLDTAFYELKKKADIERAMLDYIREHAAAFHFSGEITRVLLPTTSRSRDCRTNGIDKE
jgi:hypothetical protein